MSRLPPVSRDLTDFCKFAPHARAIENRQYRGIPYTCFAALAGLHCVSVYLSNATGWVGLPGFRRSSLRARGFENSRYLQILCTRFLALLGLHCVSKYLPNTTSFVRFHRVLQLRISGARNQKLAIPPDPLHPLLGHFEASLCKYRPLECHRFCSA